MGLENGVREFCEVDSFSGLHSLIHTSANNGYLQNVTCKMSGQAYLSLLSMAETRKCQEMLDIKSITVILSYHSALFIILQETMAQPKHALPQTNHLHRNQELTIHYSKKQVESPTLIVSSPTGNTKWYSLSKFTS